MLCCLLRLVRLLLGRVHRAGQWSTGRCAWAGAGVLPGGRVALACGGPPCMWGAAPACRRPGPARRRPGTPLAGALQLRSSLHRPPPLPPPCPRAGLGVIHRGNVGKSRTIMSPYLPSAPGASSPSAYSGGRPLPARPALAHPLCGWGPGVRPGAPLRQLPRPGGGALHVLGLTHDFLPSLPCWSYLQRAARCTRWASSTPTTATTCASCCSTRCGPRSTRCAAALLPCCCRLQPC